MGIDRRKFISMGAGAGLGAGFAAAPSTPARAAATDAVQGLDAARWGVRPGRRRDQTAALQRAVDEASTLGQPVMLSVGQYHVSGLRLPDQATLIGVAGQTHLVDSGRGAAIIEAKNGRSARLQGLTFSPGSSRRSTNVAQFYARRIAALTVRECQFIGAPQKAISLEHCAGVIADCQMSDCGEAALFSMDSKGLIVRDNQVSRCGDNGLMIWQSRKRHDGSQVIHNRIEVIHARSGGTGQNGNGISIFRSGGVMVAHNVISDCAYSAIRCNGGSNVQMIGNSCMRLGETALYAEFGFDGALIANNIVDDAGAGISMVNLDHSGHIGSCTGNILRNLIRRAPYDDGTNWRSFGIAGEAEVSVSGNVVENCAGVGIVVGWGESLRNMCVSANVVSKADIGIAVSVSPGAGGAVVTNNMVSRTARAGICAMAWSKMVAQRLSQAAVNYPQLTVQGNQEA